MKLARATFMGVRGLADATFDFMRSGAERPHDLIVVSGPRASGKTRLLEAILFAKDVVGSYGAVPDPAPFVRGPGEAAKIILSFWLDEEERAASGEPGPLCTVEALATSEGTNVEADEGIQVLLERYEHTPRVGKVEYFPWSRQLVPYGSAAGLEAIEQRLQRTSSDLRKYSFVPRLLGSLAHDAVRAQYFAAVLSYLSPTARYAPARGGAEPWACISSHGGPPVAPKWLSASEADAVLFAATATLVQLSRSLVLIDRPDLHVEPGEAAAFVTALGGLGSDNQLIVATNAPDVLAELEPSQRIHLGPAGSGA